MAQYKTEAIVLRLQKYREADALVTLLTKTRGKVTAVAKGVYKPNSKLRGGVQAFSINDMMLNVGRSTLHTLLQSQYLEMLLPLRQSYDALAYGSYWSELLEVFAQEELADETLYQLAKAGFLALALKPVSITMRALEVRLIKEQGLSPDFTFCCHCQEGIDIGNKVYFSGSVGGFLCGRCGKENNLLRPVNGAVLGLWRLLEGLSLSKLERLAITEKQLTALEGALRVWIGAQVGRPMKNWSQLKN